MSGNEVAPIIIKKKKGGGGDGHHGGAWKVAYADFVTAMMAFFMLMWLLNATTEKQRKGIADYFSPTIPINRVSGGGDGAFGGDSMMTEQTQIKNGTGTPPSFGDTPPDTPGGTAAGDGKSGETEVLEELKEMLTARAGESMVSEEAARHIVTRLTDEGLIIEVFDLPGAPLFAGETNEPTALMQDIVALVAPIFALVVNDVAINGYTQAQPVVRANNTVWDLSASRADAVRTMLQAESFPEKRIQRVSGFADRKPAAENPLAARNNRIELILLRQDY